MAVDIDIEQLTTLTDPYPVHARLRERGAHQLDDGRWIVARADDVERVLAADAAIIGFEAADPAAAIQSRMARFTDGAAHRDRRDVATAALHGLDATDLHRGADAAATAILAERATIDIMSTLARAVPISVLASALGLGGDEAVVAATELALAIAPPRGGSRGNAEAPVRRIMSVVDSSVALSDQDINTVALLFQAVDATAGLIGNSVLSAARHQAIADAAPLDFVREVSRFDPAVHFTTRRTTHSIEIGGQQIPPGAVIIVDLAAANRDPARWDHPEQFDPSRNSPSFAFGDGIHRCPGRDEALALAAGVFAAVTATGGRLTTTDPTYEPRFNLRIPSTLTWTR